MPSFLKLPSRFLLSLLTFFLLALSGFIILGTSLNSSNANPSGQNNPPKVEVITVKPHEIITWNEFSGNFQPIEHVLIKPQISGAITKIFFKEGQIVKKGDWLFQIDQRTYLATLKQAQAHLLSSQSHLRLAQSEYQRIKGLLSQKAVSQTRGDTAYNAYQVAMSNVDAAKSALTQAEINLGFTTIKSPISGRIGRAEITIGNIVDAGPTAPILTKIVSHDKIYVEFNVDEQTYIKTVRDEKNDMIVKVTLPLDPKAHYDGKIVAFDNQLDPKTGTIRTRAILQNSDHVLIPGMFAKVKLGSSEKQNVILVDDKAINTDQDKKFIYVVDKKNKVTYRPVRVGKPYQGLRIIEDGLAYGDYVIVNSMMRIRPEMIVSPVIAKE